MNKTTNGSIFRRQSSTQKFRLLSPPKMITMSKLKLQDTIELKQTPKANPQSSNTQREQNSNKCQFNQNLNRQTSLHISQLHTEKLIKKTIFSNDNQQHLTHRDWLNIKNNIEPEIEQKRQVTRQRRRKLNKDILSLGNLNQEINIKLVHDTNDPVKEDSKWVYTSQLIHQPNFIAMVNKRRNNIELGSFSTRQRIGQEILYNDNLEKLGSRNSNSPLRKQNQNENLNNVSNIYGLQHKSQPTLKEKDKFFAFYNDKIIKVMSSREGRKIDNYDALEKDLQIDKLQYIQSTRNQEFNPILSKLLNEIKLKDRLEVANNRISTLQQMDEKDNDLCMKQKKERELIQEYRRKCSVQEIIGDVLSNYQNQSRDKVLIHLFIEKVQQVQKMLYLGKELIEDNSKNKLIQINNQQSQKRCRIDSQIYSCNDLAIRFLKKAKWGKNIRIFQKLKSRLFLIWKLNLSLREVIEKFQVFYSKPFQRAGSKYFFNQLKLGSFENIQTLLEQCQWFVYDFDFNYQTPLHIAAKRGDVLLTKLLINRKSDLNAVDYVGKTPLFYSMKNGHSSIVMILLVHGANPWSDEKNHLIKLPIYEDLKLRSLFSKARQVVDQLIQNIDRLNGLNVSILNSQEALI